MTRLSLAHSLPLLRHIYLPFPSLSGGAGGGEEDEAEAEEAV